jgi:NADH-quinone oxidoreductase subunit C
MTPDEVVARVVALVPGAEPVAGRDAVVALPRAGLGEAFRTLHDHAELRFDLLSDLSAVDYLGRTPRFEVVYQLYSLPHNHRLRLKVRLEEDDPVVPTASDVWKSANWAERETYDMFGIRFSGHPDLRRILMYPEFTGFPLRKDYPVARREPLIPERDPVTNPWYPHGRTRGV